MPDDNEILIQSVPFDPSKIPGLFFWGDVSKLSQPDGSNITSLADLSGKTGAAVAFGAFALPIYRANANGHVAADFTHSLNQGLGTPGLSTTLTTVSIFYAAVQKSGATGAQISISSCYFPSGFMAWDLSAETTGSGPSSSFSAGGAATASYKQAASAAWAQSGAANKYLVIRQECDGTAAGHKVFINSVNAGFTNGANNNNPGNIGNPARNIIIGNRFDNPGFAMSMYFGEMLAYSPKPTSTQSAQIETYLAQKWQ